MTTLAALRGLSAAEEFFAFLDVSYDPAVLAPRRLHILKRMGEFLGRADLSAADDQAVRAVARAALARAYDDLAAQGALGARVFRVLKDHDPRRPPEAKGKGFVALDDLFS